MRTISRATFSTSALSNAAGCTVGVDTAETMWFEFDLGSPHRLSSARLFGDSVGSWHSRTWDVEYKLNPGNPYQTAFGGRDAFGNQWFEEPLNQILARYVRVAVHGTPGNGSVEARELELHGEPWQPVEAYLEAEDGTLTAPMAKVSDAGASAGAYIESACSQVSCSAPGGGEVSYAVTLAPGNYRLWAK